MADLRKSKAEWLRFVGREVGSAFLAALFELQELEERYSKQRTRVVAINDVDGVIGSRGVQLSGVDLTRNTTLDGQLYARITGPQAPSTISLYRRAGGLAQHLVAQGQGDTGTIVDLTEQNDSGLRVRWDLPQNAARQPGDRLRLFCVPDWLTQLDRIWDGSAPKDLEAREVFQDALERVALNMADSRRVILDALELFATGLGSRGAEFLQASSAALFTDSAAPRDPSGAVARRRGGFLPALSRAMTDDSRAGPQSLARRVVVAGPGVFAPTNRGKGRVLVHTPREFCPAARWTFRCARGGDTDHGGREEFAATVKLAGEDTELGFSGLVVGQSFSGPLGIGPLTLERSYTKQGDPNHASLAEETAAKTVGERNGNTDNGVLHWRVTLGPNGWDVSFYLSSTRAEPDLVAKAEGASSSAAFVARERSASGLTVLWKLGPNPQDGAAGSLDCNFFVVEGPEGEPDELVIVTEVLEQGLYQQLLAEQTGGALKSAPPGQETISDAYVRAGSLMSLLLPVSA